MRGQDPVSITATAAGPRWGQHGAAAPSIDAVLSSNTAPSFNTVPSYAEGKVGMSAGCRRGDAGRHRDC